MLNHTHRNHSFHNGPNLGAHTSLSAHTVNQTTTRDGSNSDARTTRPTHTQGQKRENRQTWKRENNIEQYRLSREFSAGCVYCTPRLIAVNRSIATVAIAVPRSRVVVDALLACIFLNSIIAFLLENTTKIAVSGRMKTALYARR